MTYSHTMSRSKIAVTLDRDTLARIDRMVRDGVFPNRSRAIQPALVLSHDVFNERSGTVIAVAITSQPQRAGFPLTVPLRSTRLPKPSWVKVSQIRTLAVERIGPRLARATPEEVATVVDGLQDI